MKRSVLTNREELYMAVTIGAAELKMSVLQNLHMEQILPSVDEDVFAAVAALRQAEDPGLRFWAKRVYSKYALGRPDSGMPITIEENDLELPLEMLQKKLESVSQSPFLAMKVVAAICRKRSPEALEFLTGHLKKVTDVFQLSFLTKQLGLNFPTDDVLGILGGYLSHPDHRVVANTIEGIQAIGSAKSFAVCSRFIQHSNHRVRANAARAVASYDPEMAHKIILRMLATDNQPQMVVAACYAARELKDPKYLVPLSRLLTNDLVFDDVLAAMLGIDREKAVAFLNPEIRNQERRLEKLRNVVWESSSLIPSWLARPTSALSFPGLWRRLVSWPVLGTMGVLVVLLALLSAGVTSGRGVNTEHQAKARLAEKHLSFSPKEFLKCLEGNKVQEVALFLQAGMDANTRTADGSTPLHFCSYLGELGLVKLLVKAKADVRLTDQHGFSPLHVAASQEIAQCLLQAGAAPEAVDRNGRTPLHAAVEGGRKAVVEVLLKVGADPNAQDRQGNTPLHLAGMTSQKPCIQLLLGAGAKSGVKNRLGISPRDLGVGES